MKHSAWLISKLHAKTSPLSSYCLCQLTKAVVLVGVTMFTVLLLPTRTCWHIWDWTSSWTAGTGVVPQLDFTGDCRREAQQCPISLLPHQREWYHWKHSFTIHEAPRRHLTLPDQERFWRIWNHWNSQKVYSTSSPGGFLHDQLNLGWSPTQFSLPTTLPRWWV